MADISYEDLVTRHEIDAAHAGSPPFDHYFTMTVPECNDTTIEENQDLSCFSIRQVLGGTEDLIHICDAGLFIEALRHFQRLRAGDPRYTDHPDIERYIGGTVGT